MRRRRIRIRADQKRRRKGRKRMGKVYVFLADGFEEIEGLTVVDLLRRAGVETVTVSVMKELLICGAHGIKVYADAMFADLDYSDGDMLVLPGGMPGTTNLGTHDGLCELLRRYASEGKRISAICAAPSVLGQNGLLEGKQATCYPGFEGELKGAVYTAGRVAADGTVITGKGPGTAIDFALAIITALRGEKTAKAISDALQYTA